MGIQSINFQSRKRQWQIVASLLICLILGISSTVEAENLDKQRASLNIESEALSKDKPIRYAYTPLPLNNGSYLSIVTPAEQSSANRTLKSVIKEIHKDISSILPLRANKLSVGLKLMPYEEFLKETGAPAWTNAMYYDNEILIPIKDFRKINWTALKKTIKHEYLHAVTDTITKGKCPAWLDEGLAQIVEKSDDEILQKSLNNWLEENNLIPLSLLNNGFTTLPVEQVGPAYAESKLIVLDLIVNYGGVKKLADFIRLSKFRNSRESFKDVYNISLSAYQRRLNFAVQKVGNTKLLKLLSSRSKSYL